MEEDSFRLRVDKVFGSLSESPSSLWTLTDEEIEKKQWNRDNPIRPYDDDDDDRDRDRNRRLIDSNKPIQLEPELESDLQNLDDDDEDVEDDDMTPSGVISDRCENKEEEEVRASIGLDCTLDFEEEEDEYDKVAIGKEKSGERLYMKDVNDYGIDGNTFQELPVGFNDITRDPRANHLAAKLRLKEDSETAGRVHPLELPGTSQAITNSVCNAEADITSPSGNTGSQGVRGDGLANLKPILKNKKRDNQCVSKSQKRVRFEHQFDTTSDTTREHNQEASNLALTKTEDSLVPSTQITMDRSKYTHYTLESSDDMDGESNRKAYADFLNLIKKPDATEMQLDVDCSKAPTYTPRKSAMVDMESKSKDVSTDSTSPICIALGDVQENIVSAMEEDESPVDNKGVYKSGRKYRVKSKIDDE